MKVMENVCRFVLNLKAKVKKKPLVVGELVLLKYKVAKNFVLKGKSFLFLKMLTNLENLKHR